MTNETKEPDLFSPYHDGSMQHDKDGGWVSIDDYKDLSDAKDKRIAELEAEVETLRYMLPVKVGEFSAALVKKGPTK